MTFKHSARRGLATAAGGLVVVGAGATTGVIVADMNASWSDQAALDAASAVAAQPAEIVPVRPVVVTLIEERHVTPEPVIVRKKVYRTRVIQGGTSGATAASQPTTTWSASSPARTRTTQPKPAQPRTVVAPAPKAPAPTSGGTSTGTTSKTS